MELKEVYEKIGGDYDDVVRLYEQGNSRVSQDN